jgi:hypothetical protein
MDYLIGCMAEKPFVVIVVVVVVTIRMRDVNYVKNGGNPPASNAPCSLR